MLFICVHASVCTHVYACAPWHTRRVKGQLVEVGSALYHVDPGDQPQGVRLGGEGPLPAELSHQPNSAQPLQEEVSCVYFVCDTRMMLH